MNKLALLGGKPVMNVKPLKELFKWPIITQEDLDAAMDVVVNNRFSDTDITIKFQEEFAEWQGRKFALAFPNGTMSISAAMFAIGLGMGDEIICPTKTYWASVVPANALGASVVFCNINDKLSLDPDDLERCITPKTKAIMVVHYLSYPCDMDRIMEIANKHNLYVIEDVSHAQGGMYKGKKTGNFGHVAAMSMMSEKAFAAGELGMLVTDDRKIYERAIAYAHYDRNNPENVYESEDLVKYHHIALGGVKGRANQLCTALARVQLKYYDERCAEIRKAMNYFYDQIEQIDGLAPLRANEAEGSHNGGYYVPAIIYDPSKFGGLSAKRFGEAVTAELNGAGRCGSGFNHCLHTHELFKSFDYFNTGKPTRIAFADRDVREDDAFLAPSLDKPCLGAPWFKHCDKEWIDLYAACYKKVAENYEALLDGDADRAAAGRWYGTDAAAANKESR